MRYEARKIHATALQKRLHPEWAERPWVVLDTATNRIVGKRQLTQHGAERAAAAQNAKEKKREHMDGSRGGHEAGAGDEASRHL